MRGVVHSRLFLFWIVLCFSVSVNARFEWRECALNVCDSFLLEELSVVRVKRGGMDGEGEASRPGASGAKIGRFLSSPPLSLSISFRVFFNGLIAGVRCACFWTDVDMSRGEVELGRDLALGGGAGS